MDLGQERMVMFAVTNENPIAITLLNFGANGLPPYTYLEFVGVEAGNDSVLAFNNLPSKFDWEQVNNHKIASLCKFKSVNI